MKGIVANRGDIWDELMIGGGNCLRHCADCDIFLGMDEEIYRGCRDCPPRVSWHKAFSQHWG